MGRSTTNMIVFGIAFEDGHEFPWSVCDNGENEIEEWWLKENGFESEHYNFDAGGRFDGDMYGKFKSDVESFLLANPIPVSVEFYGSYDFDSVILCIPGVGISGDSFDAEVISTKELQFPTHKYVSYKEFIRRFGIDDDPKPEWLLVSITV